MSGTDQKKSFKNATFYGKYMIILIKKKLYMSALEDIQYM